MGVLNVVSPVRQCDLFTPYAQGNLQYVRRYIHVYMNLSCVNAIYMPTIKTNRRITCLIKIKHNPL